MQVSSPQQFDKKTNGEANRENRLWIYRQRRKQEPETREAQKPSTYMHRVGFSTTSNTICKHRTCTDNQKLSCKHVWYYTCILHLA